MVFRLPNDDCYCIIGAICGFLRIQLCLLVLVLVNHLNNSLVHMNVEHLICCLPVTPSFRMIPFIWTQQSTSNCNIFVLVTQPIECQITIASS